MARQHPLEEVMTVSEIAAVYSVSVASVRAACKRGEVSCRKSGGTWLVYRPSADRRWGWGKALHGAYMKALELLITNGVHDVAIIENGDGSFDATAGVNAPAYGGRVIETIGFQDIVGYFDYPRKEKFEEVAWMMVDASWAS